MLYIGTLYLGPSMQNAIVFNYTEVSEPETPEYRDPSINRLPFVDGFDLHPPSDVVIMDNDDIKADQRMEASLYSAWMFSMNTQKSKVSPEFNMLNSMPFQCSGESCEWNNYTTLTVQSQCQSVPATVDSTGHGYSEKANISSSVYHATSHNTSAPVGTILNFEPSQTVPENSTFESSIADHLAVIIHVAAISVDSSHRAEAAECILYWEVQHFPTLSSPRLPATLAAEPPERILPKTGKATTGDEIIFEAPCNSDSKLGTCDYKVNRVSSQELQHPLGKFLEGYVLLDPKNDTHLKAFGKVTDIFARSWIEKRIGEAENSLETTLDEYMSNLATGITVHLLHTAKQSLMGKATWHKGMYEIKWLYVIYPGTMVALSSYLFLFAMWKTRRMPIWKTSLLPFLYHGFQHLAHEEGCNLSHLAWMENASKNRMVALRDEHDGLGLKLRD